MSLNPTEADQGLLQPQKHIGRHADLTMLRGRDPDSVPVRTATSRSRMVRTETSFGIKKASGPSSFGNLGVRVRRHQNRMVNVAEDGTSAPSRSQLPRSISIKDL